MLGFRPHFTGTSLIAVAVFLATCGLACRLPTLPSVTGGELRVKRARRVESIYELRAVVRTADQSAGDGVENVALWPRLRQATADLVLTVASIGAVVATRVLSTFPILDGTPQRLALRC